MIGKRTRLALEILVIIVIAFLIFLVKAYVILPPDDLSLAEIFRNEHVLIVGKLMIAGALIVVILHILRL